jgi:type VI secretion system secreted protein Hcp
MSVDLFLKIDGIDGESQSEKHKGEIDVLSWSWGVTQSGNMHTGGGGGAGRANVQDILFTKGVDKSTPKLFKASCEGAHIAKMVLSANKAGGKQMEYIKITLSDCLISSISTGGSGGQESFTENVTVNFSKVEMVYFQQDAKGGPAGNVPFSYDVKSNKAA